MNRLAPPLFALLIAVPSVAQTSLVELGRTHLPISPAQDLKLSLADFDGDGDLDALREGGVYENDGHARFRFRFGVPGLRRGDSVIGADVDGDGAADLVVFAREARIWFSDRRFGFVPDLRGPVPGTAMLPLHVADFTGDGREDVLGSAASSLALLVADPAVGLRFVAVPGTDLRQHLVFDVDADGDLDLFAAPDALLRNDGSGNFTTDPNGVTTRLSGTAWAAVGDLDADGVPDVIQTDGLWFEWLRVQAGDLTGALLPFRPAVDAPFQLALVDVDGDRRDELLVGMPPQLFRQTNASLWSPVPGQMPGVGAIGALRVADLDRDGHPDVFGDPDVLWLSDGRRGFGAAFDTPLHVGRFRPEVTAWSDFDGDGDVDALTFEASSVWFPPITSFLRNRGDGSFDPPVASQTVLDAPRRADVADFDGDGDLDVVLDLRSSTTPTALLLNDGRGNFTLAAGRLPPSPGIARPADPDGDGDIDLVVPVPAPGGGLEMFENDGHGDLTHVVQLVPGITAPAFFGDLDGDGDQDIVTSRTPPFAIGREVEIWLRNADGSYGPPTHYPPQTQIADMALADIDADGDLDVLVSTWTVRLRVLLNDGLGALTDVTATHAPATTNQSRKGRLLVGDLDDDGDPDVVIGSYVLENRGGHFFDTGRMDAFRYGVELYPTGEPEALVDIDSDGDLDLCGFDARILQNLHRHVHAPFLSRAGHPYTWRVSCQPGYLPSDAFAVGAVGTSPSRIPLGDLGTLRVTPRFVTPVVRIPAAAGSTDVEIAIPADPRLLGTVALGQFAILTPDGLVRLTGVTSDVIR